MQSNASAFAVATRANIFILNPHANSKAGVSITVVITKLSLTLGTTPSGNTVSGQGLCQVKRRAGGFSHYVIIPLTLKLHIDRFRWTQLLKGIINIV